jgi:purine-nucleoside phosphorylase
MSLPSLAARVQTSARALSSRFEAHRARVALILGSGLSGVAEHLMAAQHLPYGDIPGFPLTTVTGHAGQVVVGQIEPHRVLLFAGRVHGYEGHSPGEVAFFVRVAAALKIPTLIVTNASGGIDRALRPGQIVAISDHLNLTGTSPLTGPNVDDWGPRFPDMTGAYSRALRSLAAAEAAAALGYPLLERVYAGVTGPAYETPAEIQMMAGMGAGLVGMSTVHEVIAARHAGLEVLGLSIVANHAAGVVDQPLRHDDVTRAAAQAVDALTRLIFAIVGKLPTSVNSAHHPAPEVPPAS